jgi:MFS family permease
MLVIQSALIALGHPLSTFMGLASSQAEPNEFSWRWPIAFQGVFCVIVLAALPFLPESPRWLIAHDRADEAQEVFARLAGKGGMPVDHPYVQTQMQEIKSNIEEERRIGEATWTEVFTEGKLRNLSRVLLGAGPYLYNQWSGINSLAYFLPITFERNLGMDRQLSLILAGVLGIQYFLVSWL